MDKKGFHKLNIEGKDYYLLSQSQLDALSVHSSNPRTKGSLLPDDLSFGHLLQVFRKLKRLTFDGLAKGSGISVRALKSYEKGSTMPRGATLNRLCDYFGIEFQERLPAFLKDLLDQGAA